MRRTELEGGCYVVGRGDLDFEERNGWREATVVGRATGARAIATYLVQAGRGLSPCRRFPDSDAVLYVVRGAGRLIISGRPFEIRRETGSYVKRGETFAVDNPGGTDLEMLISVCPQCDAAEWPETMPREFDPAGRKRIVAVDRQERKATGDRFFQILVDERVGSEQVTQFIGHIPRSRAPEHHHLYEEVIMVLRGTGRMWAGSTCTPVGPGSMIYLPRKQRHCLECTACEGMTVVGLFYPAGSPAARY